MNHTTPPAEVPIDQTMEFKKYRELLRTELIDAPHLKRGDTVSVELGGKEVARITIEQDLHPSDVVIFDGELTNRAVIGSYLIGV